MSLHADLLQERHSKGGLSAVMPMEEFMAADYFLFLLSQIPPSQSEAMMMWRAWSTLYLKHAPSFIRNAEQKKTAVQISRILGVEDMEEFKKQMLESDESAVDSQLFIQISMPYGIIFIYK